MLTYPVVGVEFANSVNGELIKCSLEKKGYLKKMLRQNDVFCRKF
jgi:hypothetical protein